MIWDLISGLLPNVWGIWPPPGPRFSGRWGCISRAAGTRRRRPICAT